MRLTIILVVLFYAFMLLGPLFGLFLVAEGIILLAKEDRPPKEGQEFTSHQQARSLLIVGLPLLLASGGAGYWYFMT